MFGYQSPAEMLARVEIPGQLFVKGDQERAIVREAMGSETVVQRQVELLRRDGSTFAAHLRMKAVRNGEGKLKFIDAFVEDLTERKRAEDERLKTFQALEQSPVNILISDLTGNNASKPPPMSFGCVLEQRRPFRAAENAHYKTGRNFFEHAGELDRRSSCDPSFQWRELL
jgi:PAS domain S-box-containing protein